MRPGTSSFQPGTSADDSSAGSGKRDIAVLVLPRPGVTPIFYFEPGHEEKDDSHPGPSSITVGWRTRFSRALQAGRKAEHHAPLWLRSPINWLKSKLPADERLLMALRRAMTVTLVHPSFMSPEKVRKDWEAYLENRLKFRVGALLLYLVVLVPSVLISVLPGPNVLGFWVTFRLVAHTLALIGLIRMLRGRGEVLTEASEVLDGPVITDRRTTLAVQEHFNLIGLKGRLKRERVLARLRDRRRRPAQQPPVEEARH